MFETVVLRTPDQPTYPRKVADVDWGSRKTPTKNVRSAGLKLPSDPIGCTPRGSAMKRPLYHPLCATACTSMVNATMPMAAIAEGVQPQKAAEQQAQAVRSSSALLLNAEKRVRTQRRPVLLAGPILG